VCAKGGGGALRERQMPVTFGLKKEGLAKARPVYDRVGPRLGAGPNGTPPAATQVSGG
jgi:hypothetical protein